MARVSTYLNFPRATETVFLFYKSVFGTDLFGPTDRWRDTPHDRGTPLPAVKR